MSDRNEMISSVLLKMSGCTGCFCSSQGTRVNTERLILNKSQFERHKKFVGDYILYYGGQMADFRRSV